MAFNLSADQLLVYLTCFLAGALLVGAIAYILARQQQTQLSALLLSLESEKARTQQLDSALNDLRTQYARLETVLAGERTNAQEKLALLLDAQAKLSDTFKVLSNESLQANNQSFLHLAKSTLERYQEGARGDLEKRQQAIQELVTPVRETLTSFDAKIQELEKSRVGAYEGLTQQVRSLSESQALLRTEASNLVKALGTPRVRGRWGELQLRRVVEVAGMVNYCDFQEQQSVTTEDGRLRPDLVIKLPGGKQIVVDAKAPLAAYLNAIDAQTEEQRKVFLVDHARQLRDHLTALGRKSYWEQFEHSPDMVVMFVPGENFLSAALDADPNLIEFGVTERVMMASPITLIALLRAISFGWRQEQLAENAQKISALGRELHERITTLAGHFATLGRGLRTAVDSFNAATSSLESRVLVSARRFKDLGATKPGLAGELAVLEELEVMPKIERDEDRVGGVNS